MKRISQGRLLAVAAVALLAAGCASEPEAPPMIDLDAERAALLATDQAWTATANNPAGFAANFVDEGVMLPPDGPLVTGRDNIQAFVTDLLEMPGFSISWQPTRAEISSDATLGYTIGTLEMTVNDPNGNPVTTTGKYLTNWRRQDDGTWKAEADIFNSDAPPPTPTAEAAPDPS